MASKAVGQPLTAPGLSTWEELGRLDGNVLAILNSPADDLEAAAAFFDELQRRVPATGLHVIAAPAWGPWLAARGVAADRVLSTVDAGADVELNYFLESPTAVMWIAARHFTVVVGSAPYAVYNDQVKDILERRLTFLLGDGRFLAHTLPNRYVFVLDLPALLLRLGRSQRLEQYTAACRALVDDLFRRWSELGRRPAAADPPSCDVAAVLRTHLGPEMLAFDETSPIPLKRPDPNAVFAEMARYFRDELLDHDQRLADRIEAVSMRDAHIAKLHAHIAELHAERVAAVNLRDTIIDDLRRERETLVQRWRRKLLRS